MVVDNVPLLRMVIAETFSFNKQVIKTSCSSLMKLYRIKCSIVYQFYPIIPEIFTESRGADVKH